MDFDKIRKMGPKKEKYSEHYSEKGGPNKKETTTLFICGVLCSFLVLHHPS